MIIEELNNYLVSDLKKAEEVKIAVGLISLNGLNYILENCDNTNCRYKFLIGIDLPSEPKALDKLFKRSFKENLEVKLYGDTNHFFHPKVYWIKARKTNCVYIGSANCTIPGISKNIEMTVKVEDENKCEEISEWFEELFENGISLTKEFIDDYTQSYEKRKMLEKKDLEISKVKKKKAKKENTKLNQFKEETIRRLKEYRIKSEYNQVKENRRQVILDLKKSLGYPKFNKVEVDSFFDIWELGHLIPIPKPVIKREIAKFKKLLKMICDESIDISKRYDDALENSKYKIRGVGENLISKVLVMHRPKKYFVKNSISEKALQKYGMKYPRGVSKGEKYKYASKILKEISEEAGFENLAILDKYLYRDGSDE